MVDRYDSPEIVKQKAITAWNTRPEPRALSCEGCEHRGKYEDAVEYGYPSPCTLCKRRVLDSYEPAK